MYMQSLYFMPRVQQGSFGKVCKNVYTVHVYIIIIII